MRRKRWQPDVEGLAGDASPGSAARIELARARRLFRWLQNISIAPLQTLERHNCRTPWRDIWGSFPLRSINFLIRKPLSLAFARREIRSENVLLMSGGFDTVFPAYEMDVREAFQQERYSSRGLFIVHDERLMQ